MQSGTVPKALPIRPRGSELSGKIKIRANLSTGCLEDCRRTSFPLARSPLLAPLSLNRQNYYGFPAFASIKSGVGIRDVGDQCRDNDMTNGVRLHQDSTLQNTNFLLEVGMR